MKESTNYTQIINRGLVILMILMTLNIILFTIPFYEKNIEIKKTILLDKDKIEIILLNEEEKQLVYNMEELVFSDKSLNELTIKTNNYDNKIIIFSPKVSEKQIIKIKINLFKLLKKNLY